ncbi:MAG: 4-phosphoerythronate dehydrogenase [Bacteroidales bacterium]|jgi:erythronate-4-phosphate dehydrogenase
MNDRIKVVIDDDIPFIKGVLEPYASVVYYKGKNIGQDEVRNADALIIRTRTKCDASLLAGSKIRFIASATIGSDHIDLDYCIRNSITYTNAAGCNAWGVVQYVITALFTVVHAKRLSVAGKVVGIIGAGNVGERLARTAENLGFKILRCDPPVKKRIENGEDMTAKGRFSVDRSQLTPEDFFDLSYVLENADIISLHVPLDKSTKGFFNKELFSVIPQNTCFINSSRGEVVDEQAIIDYKEKLLAIVVDVWNNEPNINLKLMDVCDIATPHIAGYSLEGKINATVLVVNAFANFFGFVDLSNYTIDYPVQEQVRTNINLSDSFENNMYLLLNESFPLFEEDKKLRANPLDFEHIRSAYVYRREISQDLFNIIETIKPKI